MQAVAYLESLVMSLLNQLLASQNVLRNRRLEANARRSKKNIKPLKKTSDAAGSQAQSQGSQDSASVQSQVGHKKARSSKARGQEERVGVSIGTKNRKTG